MTLFETAIGPRVLSSHQIEEGYKVEVVETRHPADLDRIAYQLLATRVCGKPPPPFDKISTAGNPWTGNFYYTTETLEEADRLAKKYVEFAKWWLESPNRRGDIAYADANIIDGIATLRAEVERLREAARQVHALASGMVMDWDVLRIGQAIKEIHKITKGMVE